MTDDIVTRLRWFTCEELNCESDVICHEAANEIERLRKEVNLWMGAAERFAESNPQFEAWAYYFKARRGE